MDASIEVEGLAKRFGNVQAVRDLSFTVNEGELFGFLGPNGASKTTINMFTGLARPDAGKIRIGCIDCTTNPKAAQHLIGVVNAFVTSVAGVAFYQAIAPFYPNVSSVAPDWVLGVLFGIGGMAGIYLGARCQKFVPANAIKWMLAGVIVFTALKYIAAFFGG